MNKENLLAELNKKGFSPAIVEAFRVVKREEFVPDNFVSYAYEDIALPLNKESSISQPSTIATILQLLDLKEGQSLLEIGSGSGYVLALIATIIKNGKVYGIERQTSIAVQSKERLALYKNIKIYIKNGVGGLVECAPFDRILISASLDSKAIAYQVLEQLTEGGIMVAPIKNTLFKFTKSQGKIKEEEFIGFAFVPFISEEEKS